MKLSQRWEERGKAKLMEMEKTEEDGGKVRNKQLEKGEGEALSRILLLSYQLC